MSDKPTDATVSLTYRFTAALAILFLLTLGQYYVFGELATRVDPSTIDGTTLADLQLAATGILAAFALVLALTGVFVFRPTLGAVRAQIERLEELRDTLEHRVKERTEELEERARQVERSNRELEQFAYVASHDLQEPLRMVTSYLQLLEADYADHLDDDAREYIGYAVDGSRRMRNLVVDLLDFSRVGREDRPLKRVDLDEPLDDALSNLEVLIDEAGATIDREELPEVWAAAGEMSQVFQNLLSNAIKFRTDEAPHVTVRAERDDDVWRISVRDNGIGIDPDHVDRIFRIFQRLQSREAYEGTGIGLALCKKVVERHGGHIWAESAGEGHGTTINFTLPYVDFREETDVERAPADLQYYKGRGRELI